MVSERDESLAGKPWPQILWDAEEALGLARANRWDLLPGDAGRRVRFLVEKKPTFRAKRNKGTGGG